METLFTIQLLLKKRSYAYSKHHDYIEFKSTYFLYELGILLLQFYNYGHGTSLALLQLNVLK